MDQGPGVNKGGEPWHPLFPAWGDGHSWASLWGSSQLPAWGKASVDQTMGNIVPEYVMLYVVSVGYVDSYTKVTNTPVQKCVFKPNQPLTLLHQWTDKFKE